LAASINSKERNLENVAPFLLLAAWINHFAAKNNCLLGLTS
jgi:hypothetical protein